ncbi:MAG: glycosyltransferase family 39 protein [Firmicutes bacterium]|nr:glycosyltransferase family 39 protein [Bacillota bacterium]
MSPSKPNVSRTAFLFLIPGAVLGWLLFSLRVNSPALPAVIMLSLLTLWLCALLRNGIRDEDQWILLILAAGFMLKILYCLYTSVYTRQHDVHNFADDTDGHAGYIKYLYYQLRLPDFDPREQFQFYHPPFYHIIAALWAHLNTLIGLPIESAWENLQVLSLFWTGCCMILMVQFLRELGLSGRGMLIALLVFCLHPYFVFLSGSVNNDTLSITFMLLVMLYTLRWAKQPTMKNIVLLALWIGLGMSTKLSVAYLAPAAALVFLYKLIKTKDWVRTLLPQFAVFAVICIPLGIWWYVRCYVRFGLPIGYVPALSATSSQYLGGKYSVLQRFFDWSGESFRYLYISYGKEGAKYLEHNIPLAFLKSAVFEEQTLIRYNPLVKPVSAALFAGQAGLVICSVIGMIRGIRRQDVLTRLALIPTYALVMLSGIAFCFGYPHVCTQSFRYIVPTLFIGIAGLAYFWERKRTRIPDFFVILFCISSFAQFMLLGL